ncbi:NAD(P)/FAD-dependent oxidoreductase [Streptomyces sp. NBC_01803]|uniref:NAD(P)/FAD-dependent oxidoreductase n=1 Tax=Streptomyces sp. NBC_01803 TaxID=2975946 RepID=UPI002DDBE780|nr:FAD-binding oxidoreductase [Streptomyces sp. NBC_01803]WSA43370.1 FAD-binding oxidoreductase [Streptomyces sp. NBC_01803]
MKPIPYWLDTAPAAPDRTALSLDGRTDVAVVGAGLTGLSAALHLARKGARVTVLEQDTVGWGASGRNGGMCTTGLAIGFLTAVGRYGVPTAKSLYLAYNDAIDTVEKLVTEEDIDCDFARTGKLNLACKPAHYERLARTHEALHDLIGYRTELIPRKDLRAEIGSDYYHGAMADPQGAGLHVGKFVRGLADAAERLGVRILEKAPVTKVRRISGHRHDVTTPVGTLRADQVLFASGAYTGSSFRWLRNRVVPVGSFIVVTEPLDQAVLDELMPTRRMASDSRNILYYFRVTPDNRLLFGGRARFAMSGAASDLKSGKILRKGMLSVFPQLAGVRIDYCWGGLVDLSLDQLVHAGEHEGLFYAAGFSGHGVQMATHMGRQMADVLGGDASANVWRGLEFPHVPGHYFGSPWFLPFAGAYYRTLDVLT